MITQKNYERARNDPEFAQEFLDRIQLNRLERYVSKVVYNPFQETRTEMSTIYPLYANAMGIIGRRSRVLVYPWAFSEAFYPSVDDFLSNLFYHEGLHAKENFHGVLLAAHLNNIENPEIKGIAIAKADLRALVNQAVHFNTRNSNKYMGEVRRRITKFKGYLRSKGVEVR